MKVLKTDEARRHPCLILTFTLAFQQDSVPKSNNSWRIPMESQMVQERLAMQPRNALLRLTQDASIVCWNPPRHSTSMRSILSRAIVDLPLTNPQCSVSVASTAHLKSAWATDDKDITGTLKCNTTLIVTVLTVTFPDRNDHTPYSSQEELYPIAQRQSRHATRTTASSPASSCSKSAKIN